MGTERRTSGILTPGRPSLVGVVHLGPLPGEPRNDRLLSAILDAALRDADAYASGGADALIVENFGDVPFRKNRVEPHTVAAMALAVNGIVERFGLPVGVNVLRNDAMAAVGIAAMASARFVRVNIHTGAMLTDQGLIEGQADLTLRYRQRLGADIQIWADIQVKHAVPIAPQPIEGAAEDAVQRGLADALIVTGSATGKATSAADLRTVKASLPGVPVLVGSGVSPEAIRDELSGASGYIVGTWAKREGVVGNAVDRERVKLLVEAVRAQ